MDAEAYRWRCACCGEEKTGLPMDLAFEAPVDWDQLDQETRLGSRLSDDFCEVRYADGAVDRFIRTLLPIPVPLLHEEFRFGVWVSVSERGWNAYAEGFDSGRYPRYGLLRLSHA